MRINGGSWCLQVADLEVSVAFYRTLGFRVVDGGHTSGSHPDTDTVQWRLVGNGSVLIKLIRGTDKTPLVTLHYRSLEDLEDHLDAEQIKSVGTDDGALDIIDPDGHTLRLQQG